MIERARVIGENLLTAERNALGNLLKFTDISITGLENFAQVQEQGAVLCIFPHTSHADSIAVRFAIPNKERLVFLAKKEYWEGIKRPLGMLSNPLILLPTEDNAVPKDAFAQAIKHLNSGRYIGFAPEGTRTSKPIDQRPFYQGLRLLLSISDYKYPLVPIILKGFQAVWPKGQFLPRPINFDKLKPVRKKVAIHIGAPVYYNQTQKDSLVEDFRQRCIAEYKSLQLI